jgi:3-methylfumaryl-CoA hydratase
MNERVQRTEFCSESAVRRVAAMLDLDPSSYGDGAVLPRGWHFLLMGADARRSSVRADGFAGLGVPLPDLGLPRLMLAGRSVTWHGDLHVGAQVLRSSGVREVQHKTNASGPMAIVTVGHELRVAGAADATITETQTYILLPHRTDLSPDRVATREATREASQEAAPEAAHVPQRPAVTPRTQLHRVTPDETMLFQYSALGFNAHKIHLDRAYAQVVEGFPDLVVNGGLTTLLMTEFLRQLGHTPVAATLKYSAPLYCNRPIVLTADRTDRADLDLAGDSVDAVVGAVDADGQARRWQMCASNDAGGLAVTMDVSVSTARGMRSSPTAHGIP